MHTNLDLGRRRQHIEALLEFPFNISRLYLSFPFSHHRKTFLSATTMSDSETSAAPHPTLGGKSLQSYERPKYKSWRKKYRKMRHRFDGVLEENKKLFKEEQKLEYTAKRLREELEYAI